jgi:hypothetical protein
MTDFCFVVRNFLYYPPVWGPSMTPSFNRKMAREDTRADNATGGGVVAAAIGCVSAFVLNLILPETVLSALRKSE